MKAAKLYNSDIDLFKVKVEESVRSADIGLHSSDNDDFNIWSVPLCPRRGCCGVDGLICGPAPLTLPPPTHPAPTVNQLTNNGKLWRARIRTWVFLATRAEHCC